MEGLAGIQARLFKLLNDHPTSRFAQELKTIREGAKESEAVLGGEQTEAADTWAFCWMPAIEDYLPDAHIHDGQHVGGAYGSQQKQADQPRYQQHDNRGARDSHPGDRPRPHKPYNDTLLADRTFHNPHALEEMMEVYDLAHPTAQYRSFLYPPPQLREGIFYADEIRDAQNRTYADEKVEQGVELNRAGRYQEALKLYEQALNSYPKHVDALVARGAALANLGQLRKAVADFEAALKVDPNAENARGYLTTIQAKLEREEGSSGAIGGGGGGGGGGNGRVRSSFMSAGPRQGSEPPSVVRPSSVMSGGRDTAPEGSGGGGGIYSSTIGRLEEMIKAEGGKKRKRERTRGRKEQEGGDAGDDELNRMVDSGDDGESAGGEGGGSRKRSKKDGSKRDKKHKKRKKHKKKKRSRKGSDDDHGGRGSASDGSGSDDTPPNTCEPAPHPILERKRPLWGL